MKNKKYTPIDLPRHIRANQLPKKDGLFWAMVVATVVWSVLGAWLYAIT